MPFVRESEDLPIEAALDLIELKQELSRNGIVICPKYGCNQYFKSFWDLKYHLKQANCVQTRGERSFKCEQCNLLFQSRVNLRQHRIDEHTGSESGSPLSSPLSSPSSKGNEGFHFASSSSSTKQKTNQAHVKKENVDGDKSCTAVNSNHECLGDEFGTRTLNELNESCSADHDLSEKSKNPTNSGLEEGTSSLGETNGAKTTGAAKRKGVRPRKSTNSENSDNAASETSHPATNNSCPDQLNQTKTKTGSKKTSPTEVTTRRTSTRVRTPSKHFHVEETVTRKKHRGLKRKGNREEGEDEHETDATKQACRTPKKRQRKPKRTNGKNDNNVSGKRREDGNIAVDSDVNVTIKVEANADGICYVQEVNEDNDNGYGGSIDDDNDDDHNDDDHDDDDDDGDDVDGDGLDRSHKPTKTKRKKQQKKKDGTENETTTKKKRRRKKMPAPPEAVLLKKRVKAGHKLTCKNEGCSAKFITATGYQMHIKTCGVREEDREKFTCEMCGKEYISMQGLAYHLKTKHVESDPDDNDHSEERNEVEANADGIHNVQEDSEDIINGYGGSIDDDNDDHNDDDDVDDDGLDRSHKSTKTKKQQKKKDGDENETTTKKTRERKQLAAPSEVLLLNKRVKAGHKLTCKNEGCGAKFISATGYLMHIKTCGVKQEEREKFTCEMCGKEYISMPGLAYHMKTKHVESDSVDNDHSEERNEEAVEPEVTQSGRTRRKAASRAMTKVQQLATDHDFGKTKPTKNDQPTKNDKTIKKAELDQMITTIKGRQVFKEQEDRWSEMLKTDLSVPCPCKGCSETFTSVSSIKDHLNTCEKAASYKCLACNKVFVAMAFARNHVKYWHVGYAPAGSDMSDNSDDDFKVISSEESDEDDVEIEEVEDSGSDIDEDADEAEEIYVWDDKRKKFRKSKPKRKAYPASSHFGHIGQTESAAYKATETWRQEAHKHKELFPNLRPSVSYWSLVDSSEIEQYVPEAPMSPPFTIRRKQENRGQDTQQLPLFGSTSKNDSRVYGDVTFNVGGPVWAMDWCPVPDSRKKEEQFLAISAHRSMDQVHSVNKTFSSKGLIQLWNVGQLKVDAASSGSTPTLSLGIAHNYGAIWDISWCPSGTWEPISSNKNQSDGLSRLGVMAIACSDGFVRILSIPWPSELFSSTHMKQSHSQSSYPPVIVHATPNAVLMPCALGVAYDGQCGQARCVKWFPHSMHEKIATGFSDGTVAIWNLLTESRLLKGSVDVGGQTFRLAPFLHIMANASVVRDLAWCPHNPNIFITGSHDRCYKLWNIKTPYMPITTIRRGLSTEMHWSVSFGNVVSSEDDCYQINRFPSIVRTFSFLSEKSTTHSAVHNSTIWTVHVSDWSKLLASGDAAGEVEGVYLRRKSSSNFGIYRVYLEKHDCDKSPHDEEDNNKEQEVTAANQDEDISELLQESNTVATKEKKDASLPRTTEEVFQQHKLVLYDVNTMEFENNIDKSDPEVKRLLSPYTMQGVSYDNFCNPLAIHKVRFNPNKQAFTWLASGGAAGLARLHLVKQVKETPKVGQQ